MYYLRETAFVVGMKTILNKIPASIYCDCIPLTSALVPHAVN